MLGIFFYKHQLEFIVDCNSANVSIQISLFIIWTFGQRVNSHSYDEILAIRYQQQQLHHIIKFILAETILPLYESVVVCALSKFGQVLSAYWRATPRSASKLERKEKMTSSKELTLNDVLHVPSICSLVSSSQQSNNGFKLIFKFDKFVLCKSGMYVVGDHCWQIILLFLLWFWWLSWLR